MLRGAEERHSHSENRQEPEPTRQTARPGQRRKSLILNGRRTDIARELEIGEKQPENEGDRALGPTE